MRVLLDERPCDTRATSVGVAIAEAADDAGVRGRIVVEVVVDGITWTDRDLEDAARSAQTAEEVRLVSADLREVVLETLSDAAEALVAADDRQREAASLMQSDRRADAMECLGEALELWGGVREAVTQSCLALSIDLDEVRVGDRPALAVIDPLGEHLRSIRASLQGGDPVGLADTLMYDLPEVVADWRALLDAIRGQVEEGTNSR